MNGGNIDSHLTLANTYLFGFHADDIEIPEYAHPIRFRVRLKPIDGDMNTISGQMRKQYVIEPRGWRFDLAS